MLKHIIMVLFSLTLVSCQSTSNISCSSISQNELSKIIYGKSLLEFEKYWGFTPSFKRGRGDGEIDPHTYGTYHFGQSTNYNPRNPDLSLKQFVTAVDKIKYTNDGLEYCDKPLRYPQW